jgi:hypothetical protein
MGNATESGVQLIDDAAYSLSSETFTLHSCDVRFNFISRTVAGATSRDFRCDRVHFVLDPIHARVYHSWCQVSWNLRFCFLWITDVFEYPLGFICWLI